VRYLLDTDHISILQKQSGPEFAALAGHVNRHDAADFALSVISFHEQMLGAHPYISRATSSAGVVRGYGPLARLLRDFAMAPVLPFDAAAAALFDELVTRRLRMGTMDLRIGAIAVSNGLVLLTRNVGDFGKIAELQTADWTV
jgi:tRNA(fMet)-specific endonuclease VapC